MDKQEYKKKLQSLIQLELKELNTYISDLREKVLETAKAKGGKNGANSNPHHNTQKSTLTPDEKQMFQLCQEVMYKVDNAFEQYKKQDTILSFAKRSFHFSKDNSNLYELSSAEAAIGLRTMENELAHIQEQIDALALQKQVHVSSMEGLVSTNNSKVPLQSTWFSVGYYIGAIFLMVGELPINFAAISNMSGTLSRVACLSTATFICVVCSTSAHYTGKRLAQLKKNESWFEQVLTLLLTSAPSIVMLIVVVHLRRHDNDAMFSLVNIALVLVAVVISYYHTKPEQESALIKEYFGHKAEAKRIGRQIMNLKKKALRLKNQSEYTRRGMRLVKGKEANVEIKVTQEYLDMAQDILNVAHYYMQRSVDAISKLGIKTYRSSNTAARLALGIPLVKSWNDEDDNDLPELDKAPISPKL